MVGDGGVAPPVGRAGVAGDPAAVVEYLDRPVVDACIDELTDEPVWRGIPVSVDLDMIVGADPASRRATEEGDKLGQASA